MGDRVEVWGWIENQNPTKPGEGYGQHFYYVQVWRGQSLLRGLLAARKARRTYGCIKIEWRP
jgi:hypothetical protein